MRKIKTRSKLAIAAFIVLTCMTAAVFGAMDYRNDSYTEWEVAHKLDDQDTVPTVIELAGGTDINETDVYAGDDTIPVTPAEEAAGFCVVIDAGHGGSDGGTVSGEILEKDINLSVALKLKAILEDNNIEVVLTRSSDEKVSLSQRASIANESNADFFISLHCNYYEGDARIKGLECYYDSPDEAESKGYAESITNAVSLSEDIKVRDVKTESYYVLQNTRMPAVLVEMGFLSNDSECEKLTSDEYQEILSQKIAEGILQYADLTFLSGKYNKEPL